MVDPGIKRRMPEAEAPASTPALASRTALASVPDTVDLRATFARYAQKKARKERTCALCGGMITKGQMYHDGVRRFAHVECAQPGDIPHAAPADVVEVLGEAADTSEVTVEDVLGTVEASTVAKIEAPVEGVSVTSAEGRTLPLPDQPADEPLYGTVTLVLRRSVYDRLECVARESDTGVHVVASDLVEQGLLEWDSPSAEEECDAELAREAERSSYVGARAPELEHEPDFVEAFQAAVTGA